MPPLRFRLFSRSIQLRGPHTTSAFALALAFGAGLACNENAPTETRASSAPTELGATGDEPALAVGNIPTTAIVLPVNQNVSTAAPAPAFRVNQTGTGPNGIFQITNAANTQNALQGLTNGKGRAGFFQITTATNAQPALQGQTAGTGFAVYGLATSGTGKGGSFQIANAGNSKDALTAQTNGTGRAGLFQITTAASGQPALEGVTNGKGWAIRGTTTGTGRAGEFDIISGSNSSIALVGYTYGLGPAGHFEISNDANPGPDLKSITNGTGPAGDFNIINPNNSASALVGYTVGRGSAGYFEVKNRANSDPALKSVTSGSGPAGLFQGNVTIFGTLTKTAGSFKIDHPLDPDHKYLSHSFVESPDMKNVYDGTVTLDAEGRATVELPAYFEALNKDFRYQLTAIGAPGPNLYIAEGVQENHFRIAGGRAYAHVSWQVTGIRHDAYAEEHRIRVEEEKPAVERDLVAQR